MRTCSRRCSRATRVVASLDESARRLFTDAASHVGEIRQIVWVNPAAEDEDCVAWLETGATAQRERMLGVRPTD